MGGFAWAPGFNQHRFLGKSAQNSLLSASGDLFCDISPSLSGCELEADLGLEASGLLSSSTLRLFLLCGFCMKVHCSNRDWHIMHVSVFSGMMQRLFRLRHASQGLSLLVQPLMGTLEALVLPPAG